MTARKPHGAGTGARLGPGVARVWALVEDGILVVIFWTLCGVVFAQFFSRYFLEHSLGWTEEIARYILIGMTFIGSVVCVRRRTHLRIEILSLIIGPQRFQRLERFVLNPLIIIALIWTSWVGWQIIGRTRRIMTSVDLPLTVLYWPIVIALVAMAIRYLLQSMRAKGSDAEERVPWT